MRATPALLALLLLASAACGDDDATGSADAPGGTVPPGATAGGGDGDLFVEVAHVGGFQIAGAAFRTLPEVAVYGDGTVLAPGAITMQFPGPAVLPLFTGQLDAGDVDELLAAAADAGLLGNAPDLGSADRLPIADAATTRITVVVDGDEHVVEAYALELSPEELRGVGLTEDQLAARRRLGDFVNTVTQIATPAAEAPYDPERYRILSSPAPDPAGQDVPPNELAWPAGVPEPVDGECTAVAGDAATALEAALPQATEITRWLAGDRALSLLVRPLLPHEPDCPDPDAGAAGGPLVDPAN